MLPSVAASHVHHLNACISTDTILGVCYTVTVEVNPRSTQATGGDHLTCECWDYRGLFHKCLSHCYKIKDYLIIDNSKSL